jgi:hypothetical protein
VLVVLNTSAKPQTVGADPAQAAVSRHCRKELLGVSAEAAGGAVPAHIRLQPLGFMSRKCAEPLLKLCV